MDKGTATTCALKDAVAAMALGADVTFVLGGVALTEQQLILAAGFLVLVIFVGVLFAVRRKPFLTGVGKYAACPLIEKEIVSHDVRRFRFQLPSESHVLGLPIGKHVFCRAKVDGETVIRSYTPVTDVDTKGYFDLVLKIYSPLAPRFPNGGVMSQHLDSLTIGDTVEFSGPTGHVRYEDNGVFALEKKKGNAVYRKPATKIGMIAGGTGITPILQILRHIRDKEQGHHIEMWLLFANKTQDDILLQKELESVENLHLWYTLDEPPRRWQYSKGFISADMIKEHMPPPSSETQILLCGPPPMIKFACEPNLEKLGYTEDMIIKF